MKAQAAADGKNAISSMQNALPIDILQPENIADAVACLVCDKPPVPIGSSRPGWLLRPRLNCLSPPAVAAGGGSSCRTRPAPG
jgi:hypothetical protein